MRLIPIIILAIFSFSCAKEKRSNKAAEKMQDFVIDISKYAKQTNPNFLIIPQNGIELAFNHADPLEGLNVNYMNAVDGFGVEALFYNETYALDNERLPMLQTLKSSKKILVSEWVTQNNHIEDAYTQNHNEGFICFTRNANNYHYTEIPDTIPYENSNDIHQLSDAKNYLYIINSDHYSSKQDFINAISNTNYDLVLIDLFYEEIEFTPAEINLLKTKANGGKRLVISYMNIGSAEKFRYYWKAHWTLHIPMWIHKKYDGYNDEFWVKFWNPEWQQIIYGNDQSYLKKILNSGYDGVYLDNIEAFYFLYYKD